MIIDDIDAMVDCPQCNATVTWEESLLGCLGNLNHYRCPCCGWQWAEEFEPGGEA